MSDFFYAKNSPIHSLDARVKIILTLAFLIFMNLAPAGAWPAYVLFLCTLISCVILARINLWYVWKRSLISLPFILAAVPLIFTGPQANQPAPFYEWLGIHYSPEGFLRFLAIFLKCWISFQAGILFVSTTHFMDILDGMSHFKTPELLITIIGLMWRYLFIIRDEAVRMMHARESRSCILNGYPRGALRRLNWQAQVTGKMAGSLLLRSLERSERVYQAMVLRGYNGKNIQRINRPLFAREKFLIRGGIVLLFLFFMLSLMFAG